MTCLAEKKECNTENTLKFDSENTLFFVLFVCLFAFESIDHMTRSASHTKCAIYIIATDLSKDCLKANLQYTHNSSTKSQKFSSVQDGIYALGKAHMRSTPSLRSSPNVAFETVPMFV